MVWDGDSDQRISKIFEDNHTRASSNPLEMGLSAQVGAGSEVGLGLRSKEQLMESLTVLSRGSAQSSLIPPEYNANQIRSNITIPVFVYLHQYPR